MSNESTEVRAEPEDPLVERIFEGLSEMREVWGKDITLSDAIRLHQDPVSGYDFRKEKPARLAIIDESGREIPILPVYAQTKKFLI